MELIWTREVIVIKSERHYGASTMFLLIKQLDTISDL